MCRNLYAEQMQRYFTDPLGSERQGPSDTEATQPNIAPAILTRRANYVLSVKDNQLTLTETLRDFFDAFQIAHDKRPHRAKKVVETVMVWLEVRRCYVADQLDCLHAPERRTDLSNCGDRLGTNPLGENDDGASLVPEPVP